MAGLFLILLCSIEKCFLDTTAAPTRTRCLENSAVLMVRLIQRKSVAVRLAVTETTLAVSASIGNREKYLFK